MFSPQYLINTKVGDTVTYGSTNYRVQDDGKGFKHIVVQHNGQRKKVGLKQVLLFEPGTLADYIFNGWFEVYSDFETWQQFTAAELIWLTL